MDRPETIEETAELVSAAGGTGIAMRVDHARSDDVAALAARIDAEHGGLDVLVNDVWGGDGLIAWDTPFWEHDLAGRPRSAAQRRLVAPDHERTRAPLLRRRAAALVVEVTDGIDDRYRGNLFYDLAKAARSGSRSRGGRRAAPVRRHRDRADAGLPALGGDARPLRRDRGRRGATRSRRDATSRPPRRRASSAGRSPTWPPTPTAHAGTGRRFPPGSSPARTGSTDLDGSTPDWGAHYAEHVIG